LRCDLKTKVDFSCHAERTLRCDLKTEVNFVMPAKRTLECDLKIEVDFVPHGADFDMRLWKSTLRHTGWT
jgi:hypothetical protein